MTNEEHQELGAWRLAAKLTGAINEEAACRKTTPQDVMGLKSGPFAKELKL